MGRVYSTRHPDTEVEFKSAGIHIEDTVLTYETLVEFYHLLGPGKLRITETDISFDCRWCDTPFSKRLWGEGGRERGALSQSLVQLPYCSPKCATKASVVRSRVKRVFRELGATTLDIGTLAEQLSRVQGMSITPETAARNMMRSAVVIPLPKGRYKLIHPSQDTPKH